MRRGIHIFLFLSFCFFIVPSRGGAYLLSPRFVLKKMVSNYASLQGLKVTQRLEAYGEDTMQPFASVDEKVEMHPLLPVKIWIGGQQIQPGSDLPPEMGADRYLIAAQRRYGFYKDVFLNHDVNLLKTLLERLGVTKFQDRLRLLYPRIAYQIGGDLLGGAPGGIWVDKDRFIPLRLAGVFSSWQNGKSFHETVDIRYESYRLVQGRAWLPSVVTFYVNGKLALRIRMFSVTFMTH